MTNEIDKTKKSIQAVLDCFSGADGGATFIKFKFAMEDISRDANNGDKSSLLICDLVYKFKALIDAVQ